MLEGGLAIQIVFGLLIGIPFGLLVSAAMKDIL